MALAGGEYVSGPYVRKVEEKMKEICNAQQAIAVSSGTMGLKIALDAMGIKPGDMVIVPDITFVACATVVLELNAIPVFVDVDMETYVMDEMSTLKAVTIHGDKIKAIMAVRLGGEPIPDWVYGLRIPVLIDSAHSMDPLDEKAVAAVYSFHPSKIVSGTEGGCIVTNSAGDAETARRLRTFGFQEGTRIAVEMGYKAYMNNISAILIWHNLMILNTNLVRRAQLRNRFNEKLGLNRRGLGMYMVMVPEPDKLCEAVGAIRHYPMPLSLMTTGAALNEKAFKICNFLVSLPFHEWMTDDDVDILCATIQGIKN